MSPVTVTDETPPTETVGNSVVPAPFELNCRLAEPDLGPATPVDASVKAIAEVSVAAPANATNPPEADAAPPTDTNAASSFSLYPAGELLVMDTACGTKVPPSRMAAKRIAELFTRPAAKRYTSPVTVTKSGERSAALMPLVPNPSVARRSSTVPVFLP